MKPSRCLPPNAPTVIVINKPAGKKCCVRRTCIIFAISWKPTNSANDCGPVAALIWPIWWPSWCSSATERFGFGAYRTLFSTGHPDCGSVSRCRPSQAAGLDCLFHRSSPSRMVGAGLGDLWQGDIQEVIHACECLVYRCPEAEKAATYFSHNEQRMQYKKFRSAGYLVGSGTVESACKQIPLLNASKPGAQWNVAGAVQTAKARAAWLSGDWKTLCAQRASLPMTI